MTTSAEIDPAGIDDHLATCRMNAAGHNRNPQLPGKGPCNRLNLFLTVQVAFAIQMQTRNNYRMLTAFFYFYFFGFTGDFLFRKSAHATASKH